MVIKFRKSISVFIVLLTVLTSFGVAFALKIDGADSGYEWDGAKTTAFTNNNNGVEVGILSYIVDGFDVYLRLQIRDDSIMSSETKAGFIICVEGEEIFRINLSEKTYTTNSDKYSVKAEMSYYENSGVYCEAKIGVKSGVGKSIGATVCFLDNEGVRSNVHPFEIVNEEETSSTTKETTERTTKEITTKEKATKEKTTKEKTTKEKTTRKSTTVTEKSNTTRSKSTSSENSKKHTQELPIAVVDSTENTVLSSTYIYATENVEDLTISKVQYYYADNLNDNYNKGKALKITVCAVAGLGFLLTATLACVKFKNSSSKSEEKVDDEPDKD